MKKFVLIFLAVVLLVTAFPVRVSASKAITDIDSFKDLENSSGDSKYLSPKYRDNYRLDIKKLGFTDGLEKGLNSISNAIFGLMKWLSYFFICIFYRSISLDLSSLLGDQINSIMEALNSTIFDGLFLLAFLASAFFLIQQLIKHNLQAMLGEICKVVVILVMSMAIVIKGDVMLSFINSATKEISIEALGSIAGEDISSGTTMDNFATKAAGILWGNLVHKPWVALEFGEKYPVEQKNIDDILSTSPSSPERKKIIEELNDTAGIFGEDTNIDGDRISLALVFFFPILIKGIVYGLLSLIMLAFQVVTIFYFLTCPLILILAVVPAFGGLQLIGRWFTKIIETQICILILCFIIGLIVKFDALIFDSFSGLGWLFAMIIQLGVAAVLIWKWRSVIEFMSGVTRSVYNPRRAINRAFGYGRGGGSMGNVYDYGMEFMDGFSGDINRLSRQMRRSQRGQTRRVKFNSTNQRNRNGEGVEAPAAEVPRSNTAASQETGQNVDENTQSESIPNRRYKIKYTRRSSYTSQESDQSGETSASGTQTERPNSMSYIKTEHTEHRRTSSEPVEIPKHTPAVREFKFENANTKENRPAQAAERLVSSQGFNFNIEAPSGTNRPVESQQRPPVSTPKNQAPQAAASRQQSAVNSQTNPRKERTSNRPKSSMKRANRTI